MCAYFDQRVLFIHTEIIKHMETYREIDIKTLPHDRQQVGCHSRVYFVRNRSQAVFIKRLQAENIFET